VVAVPAGGLAAASGYVGGQRQGRERVARQEAFRREIAVRVEVRERLAVLLVAQQPQLGLGLGAAALGALPGVAGERVIVSTVVLDLAFGLSPLIEGPPPPAGGVELSRRRPDDAFEPFLVPPGGVLLQLRHETGEHPLGALPGALLCRLRIDLLLHM